jgi:small-conductance mechanosensitive channel/CRP-like cAMP-binding protein
MIAVAWPWHDLSPDVQATIVGGLYALPLLIVLQAILLPPPRRRWVLGPTLLIILALLLLAAGMLAGDDAPGLRHALDYTAYFVILVGVGRCLFALVFFGVLHWLHQHVPRIFVDIIQSIVYGIALLAALVAAGVEPQSLAAGSAVLSVVLGFALKDTLGNLFAGIAIQAQQPFEIGDWIQFDSVPAHIGRVVEINWRAIKVVTLDDVEVIVPNGTLGIGSIVNFTKPARYSRRSVYVHAPYDVPPRIVIDLIVGAIADAFGVLREPAPSVVTNAFDERGVQYWIRFFTDRFELRDGVDGGVRDCIWYALHRAGIAIPGVQQAVTMQSPEAPTKSSDPAARREQALRGNSLFAELSDDERRRLAGLSSTRLYAPNEVIIREGAAGEEMFVMLRGYVTISFDPPDAERVTVNRLGPGDFFGEMSLVRGAKRSATVQALDECEVIAIHTATLRQLLDTSPGLGQRIERAVAERQSRLEDVVETLTHTSVQEPEQHFLMRVLEQFLPQRD